MKRAISLSLLCMVFTLLSCYNGLNEVYNEEYYNVADTVVNISSIPGVTPPNYGESPVNTITQTEQYTGTVSWSGSPVTFAASTVYTATITLSAKTGYTLAGVTEDFFTVAGATSYTNSANSGVVTVEFPQTGAAPPTIINISAIAGVSVPVLGAIPVTAITDTSQYTGTVTWDGGWAWSNRFGGQKAYTATITLTAKSGYTLTGVTANFFTVAGTSTTTNSANSGVITAIFPATATVNIGDSALGGKVAYILQNGDAGYIANEQRGLIAASTDQDGGSGIIWAPSFTSVPGTVETLGTGSANTDKIIILHGAGTTYASGLARAYNGSGYNDWFLPSRYELDKLYANKAAIGGFSNAHYWSSTEFTGSANFALAIDFTTGEGWLYTDTKNSTNRVRAVRVF